MWHDPAAYATISILISLASAWMSFYTLATLTSRPVNMKDNCDWLGTSLLGALIFLVVFALSLITCQISIWLGTFIFLCAFFPAKYAWKRSRQAEKEMRAYPNKHTGNRT